jgi:hypothetical protein
MGSKIVVYSLSLILAIGVFYSVYRFRDRHPGYEVRLLHRSSGAGDLKIGFGKAHINPDLTDRWQDVNDDARFRISDGDIYEDINGNGRFDPVWIAGFHNQRAATGIHDTLWARSMVIEQDEFRMAVCVLDAIGFGNDDIVDLRKQISEVLDLDYLIVASTHTHQAPDLIGMWGDGDYRRGVNDAYLGKVKSQGIQSLRSAVEALRPAAVRYAQDLTIASHLVEDSRKPEVLDAGLRILQVMDRDDGKNLGSVIGWANHPETLWSHNTLISSDFPHYLREAIERGIYQGDSLWIKGIGGTCLFFNGAIGGLMTTSPHFPVMSLRGDTTYLQPGFDKARAQGETLAFFCLQMLADSGLDTNRNLSLEVIARSIVLPMHNKLFRLGNWLGVLDRGTVGWFQLRSEIAYWQLGNTGFLHVPGEIYPELVNGGVEAPPGRDFMVEPLEIPPLRALLPTPHTFVVGLSNDMVGYIIPKSEWDERKPFLYHQHHSPYGEINSLGPETAPILHRAIVRMMEDYREGQE